MFVIVPARKSVAGATGVTNVIVVVVGARPLERPIRVETLPLLTVIEYDPITLFAVNSFAKRKRVPEIDFGEAALLYPLVAFCGAMGSIIALTIFTAILTDKTKSKPLDGPDLMHLFHGAIWAVLAFVAAAAPIVKFLLNTRWKDAFSIAVRFFLVFLLLLLALWASLIAIFAVIYAGR